MTDKTLLLITGANQGLGYYAVQQLAATGKYHILLGSRDLQKANKAIEALASDTSVQIDSSHIEPLQIDVSSDESIQKAANEVERKYGYLDILMANAGISRGQGTTREQFQEIFNTNVFGAAVTVDTFLPLLRKSTAPEGKRITFTSSGLASIHLALNPPVPIASAENFPIYRSSKTAINMMMAHYSKLLEKEGFVVGATEPGYCATNLNDYHGLKDPRDGAKVLIRGATASKKEVHAMMIDEDKGWPW